jgi:hypothetical protein
VCATSKHTSGTKCLTSYDSPRTNSDLLDYVTIWEACRATSAATSFFDSIAIGRYKEEFVDGATGANNPVFQLWTQAQDIWCPEQFDFENKIKCIVSIGTGVPSLTAFNNTIPGLAKALVAISTETEETAEMFCREGPLIDQTVRYYRFNVLRGLEGIGLEEASKESEITAVTGRYVESQDVNLRMKACGSNLSEREC